MDGTEPREERTETAAEVRRRAQRSVKRVIALGCLGVAAAVAGVSVWWVNLPNYWDSQGAGALNSNRVSQRLFVQSKVLDEDGDGVGEHGWFGAINRLSQPPRGPDGWSDLHGTYTYGRHHVTVWLPGPAGTWVTLPERTGSNRGPVASPPKPSQAVIDAREKRWLAYSYPRERGEWLAFVINEAGVVWYTDKQDCPYDADNPPASGAALTADGSRIANGHDGEKGQDGRYWYRWK